MPSRNEEKAYGQPSSHAPYPQPEIRSYTPNEEPAKNIKLWTLLNKLDGYGVADQQKRLLLLTDQDNRVFALRYLAQHLDVMHLLDLYRSLTATLWVKIAEHGRGHFDGFDWPWQWGPEPPKYFIPLPDITEMQWERSAGEQPSTETAPTTTTGAENLPTRNEDTPTWNAVRQVMLDHVIHLKNTNFALEVSCSCGKEFPDGLLAYEKHQRARVKELFAATTSAPSESAGG